MKSSERYSFNFVLKSGCKLLMLCKSAAAAADRIRWLQLHGASPLNYSYHQHRSHHNNIHHDHHHACFDCFVFLSLNHSDQMSEGSQISKVILFVQILNGH